jgi:Uma2 family endonuclease
MIALAEIVERDDRRREDHFAHLRGATWSDYERLLEIRGEQSAPRLTYLKGTLEIMSPSRAHDSIKSVIGRVIEVWCLEQGVEFSTCGSWTLRNAAEECGAEPDECYVFGEVADPQRPDLAIEVVWTRGGIDKLEVYRRLGVEEVWYWRRGRIHVYRLRGDRYEELPGSEALPGIDLEHLVSFLDRPTTSRAIRDYRASLRSE